MNIRSQRNDSQWSTPHFGVSHRYINGQQCTITVIGKCIGAVVFGHYGSGRVMANAIEATVTFATIGAARLWCEKIASKR